MDITKNWFDSNNTMDNGSFSVTLAWNLTNMLPFSSNMVSLKETQKNLEKLELSIGTVLQNGEMEINSLVDKLKKCESSIEAMEYNVVLAEKAYNMTFEAYKVGTTELLDVRDAESQLSQAKLGLMNEKYTYLTTLLDLEYAINGNL
jgi:outer membrane protein TolC